MQAIKNGHQNRARYGSRRTTASIAKRIAATFILAVAARIVKKG